MELVRDFLYLKTSDRSTEEVMDLASNALGYFRSLGEEEPQHPLPLLFQGAGFIERLMILSVRAERATPSRTLTDEEMYTPAFAEALNSATVEFELAMKHCLPIMQSVPSAGLHEGLLASCFLNPLNSGTRAESPEPFEAFESRMAVCEHALTLSLCYSQVPWTQEMYDHLTTWFAPALLLCTITNTPPMASPAVRVALDWARSLDDNPMRRFKSMAREFTNMVSPSPQANVRIELPPDFTV